MSVRDFVTVPGGAWARDEALNGCREDSIAIFKVIVESSDRDWRLEVSPASHAFSVRRCFQDRVRFVRWDEERISRGLAELRARGCLTLYSAHGREWLEVPDRLCYAKGHKSDKPLDPPVQRELALPPSEPTLFALPESGGKPPAKAAHWNESKKKSQKRARADESRASATPAQASGEDSKIRAKEPGGDSGTAAPPGGGEYSIVPRFERDEEDFAGELGDYLRRTLGVEHWPRERVQSGAMWLGWMKSEPRKLMDALQEWNVKTPEEKAAKGGNPAAFVSKIMGRKVA